MTSANGDRSPSVRPVLSVVVPAYDEILTIQELLRQVDEVPVAKEILVVDDGSTDGTRELLARLAERWPREPHPHSSLRVLLQPQNGGKGRAIRRGIAEARGEITIIQDADLEYEPQDYLAVIAPIRAGKADVCYGSRYAGTSRRVAHFWHTVGNKALTLLSNMLTDLDLTDMETCYKAFRTEVIQAIPLREDRFGFEPEVTAKVARLGLRIWEVPIHYHGRSYAEGKKIGWRDGVEALTVMLRSRVVDEVSATPLGRQAVEVLRRHGPYNAWLFEQLRPWLGRRILEVGSGYGNLSKLLLDAERLVLTGLDEAAIASLELKFQALDNVEVAAFDMTQPPPADLVEGDLDTVLCVNGLERAEDDQAALLNLRAPLERSGGRLVLVVPAHPAAYGPLDEALEHRRRYDSLDLRRLLEAAGYEVERVEHLNALGLLGWLVNGHLLRRRRLPRFQVASLNRLIPLLRLERHFHLPLGLSLLAVARVPARRPAPAPKSTPASASEQARA